MMSFRVNTTKDDSSVLLGFRGLKTAAPLKRTLVRVQHRHRSHALPIPRSGFVDREGTTN